MDEVTLEQVFLRVLLVHSGNHHSTIAPNQSVTTHEVCDSPDQAAHYHSLGNKLATSSLGRSPSKDILVSYEVEFTC